MMRSNEHRTRISRPTAPDGTPFVGQPAAIIGVGGIGHRIVLFLKALLIAIFGQVPAGIRLLVFDIDDENLSLRVGDRLVALERDSEFFCLGPVPVARIRHNLDNLPTIAGRLPCLRDLPPIAAARAAKAIRPIGALAFQWQFPYIQAIVREALWSLAGRDSRGDDTLLVDPSRGLKIIQVGSDCGGTNSGIFIELGYLLRDELEALGTLGDACTIIGIGMLPGAFRGIYGPNLAPNTVAALKELESIMLNGDQALPYRDGTVLDPARPPFDMYLLVDAVDEAGRVWVSRDDLCQMVARALLVLSATQLGEQGDVSLDNVDEVLSGRTPDGHGTFFGSIGLAMLEFPAERLIQLFAARHARTVIEEVLLRQPEPEEVQTEVSAWCQTAGLSLETILSELARDDTETPLGVALEPPALLRQVSDHDIPQQAIQFVQAWGRVQLGGDYRAWVRQHGQALSSRLTAEVRQRVEETVNVPPVPLSGGQPPGTGGRGFGVARAQAILASLRQALADLHDRVSTRLESSQAEEKQRERATAIRAEELIHATETGWPFRHGRVMNALDEYLQAAQSQYAAALDVLVAERAIAVVGKAIEEVESLARVLATTEARLRTEADTLDRESRELARTLEPRRGDPALVLVDEAYASELYAQHAPDLSATVAAMLGDLGDEGLLGWTQTDASTAPALRSLLSDVLRPLLSSSKGLSKGSTKESVGGLSTGPDVIIEALRHAASAPFEPIREMTVEAVIAAQPDHSSRARLAALREEALPALNLDLARLPGGDASLRRIEVLGVADHTRSIFRSEARHIISTHDPHTVLALSLTVGVPYTALQAWPDYLAEYERARRLRPLHTLPAFQTQGQEPRLALGLGLVFDLIYTHGAYFYYRPADELAKEMQLAQGAENTAKALARQDELVCEVIDRAEAHIEHIGTAQALEAMAAWCTPDGRDDELARELKRLVRDYADLIRRNARLQGTHAQ